MKRKLWILLLTLIMLLGSVTPSFGASAFPELIGETAIVIDMKTGEILHNYLAVNSVCILNTAS